MKVFAATNKGQLKDENEDRLIINKTILANGSFFCDIPNGFVAVADGVGGNNAGGVASHFVAYKLGECSDLCAERLKKINSELIEFSNSDSSLNKMATTLSGVAFQDKRTMIFHIGNTRVYSLMNGKYLKQLTRDDTTLEYLLLTGKLAKEEAAHFDRKNEITACFGAGDPNLLCVKMFDISENVTVYMLTTDGIHDYISIDDMEDVFAENKDFGTVCKRMIDLAVEHGSQDDLSILIGVI